MHFEVQWHHPTLYYKDQEYPPPPHTHTQACWLYVLSPQYFTRFYAVEPKNIFITKHIQTPLGHHFQHAEWGASIITQILHGYTFM